MSANRAYSPSPPASPKPPRSRTDFVQTVSIELPEEGTSGGSYHCFSWSRTCDVLGNRQGAFIVHLRPLRASLIAAEQALREFEFELERYMFTRRSAIATAKAVRTLIDNMNGLTMHTQLNIPPDENEMLRAVSYDLVILGRLLEEVALRAPEQQLRRNSTSRLDTLARQGDGVRFLQHSVAAAGEDESTVIVPSSEAADRAYESDSSWNVHSLKERILRNCETVEKLIKFVDRKTERRWWLRDVINFLQLFVKLSLFISAAISVAYHEEQAAPIITLGIAIIQGIIELLDQYFIKHTKPEEIKLNVVSTLTGLQEKS